MSNGCLDSNRIRDYLQGRLADDESGTIAEHLESCQQCEGLASEVERDSDWLINHVSVAGSQRKTRRS